jgi:hypothetical protein
VYLVASDGSLREDNQSCEVGVSMAYDIARFWSDDVGRCPEILFWRTSFALTEGLGIMSSISSYR